MTIDSERTLTVGEVAKRSGMAVSTLHFYERKGLIQSWRTSGNQRRFPRKILRKLAIIQIAQRAGLPLTLIKEHMDRFPDQPITAAEWTELGAQWHKMLGERIASLTQLRDKLDGCIGCGCLSLNECPLRNPDDMLASEGAGARLLVDPSGKTGRK